MTSTPHTRCSHPSTSAARAQCRKERAANRAKFTDTIASFFNPFYDAHSADDIADALDDIARRAGNGQVIDTLRKYYEGTIDAEEMIGEVSTIALY